MEDNFIDVEDVDFSNSVFGDLQKLNGFNGEVENCPETLPLDYVCENDIIFGPEVNITDMELSRVFIDNVNSIKQVHGKALTCPQIDMKLDGLVACVDGYILGPSVSLDGFPLHLLISYEQRFEFDLSFASVGELIMIKDDTPCEKKEEYLSMVEQM